MHLKREKIRTNVDVFQYLAEFTTQRPNCANMSLMLEPSMTYGRNHGQAVSDRIGTADANCDSAPATIPR